MSEWPSLQASIKAVSLFESSSASGFGDWSSGGGLGVDRGCESNSFTVSGQPCLIAALMASSNLRSFGILGQWVGLSFRNCITITNHTFQTLPGSLSLKLFRRRILLNWPHSFQTQRPRSLKSVGNAQVMQKTIKLRLETM